MFINSKGDKQMNVCAVAKRGSDVVLDTCLVPAKKTVSKEIDDFFPETSLISDNIKKTAEEISKEQEAENVGNLVGNIINYFG